MATENTRPCGDFVKILADLESENLVTNASAINRALALISQGKIPEHQIFGRLIAGLASNMEKPDHDSAVKRGVSLTLEAIRVAIFRNMGSSARGEALHAIRRSFMHESLRLIQRDASMVRLWPPVQDQLLAVKVLCNIFRLSPVNIDNTRCVTAFASLMLSPHSTVVCACADALLSLPTVVPGFAYTMARAYCLMLATVPPQSSLEISSMVVMLGRLKQVSKTMVHHPGFDGLAVDVLAGLANRNLAVRKNVLNLVVSLLTPRNVSDVLARLDDELDMAVNIPDNEYQHILEGAISECYSAFPESIVKVTLDSKYRVYIDSIRYIIDIVNASRSVRSQLLKGLLRVLRHVKSPLVCGAAVWAISFFSESPAEINDAIAALSCFFKVLLDRRKIEKQILEGKVEDQYKLSTDYYGVTARDAQGEHQKPWLMEMEELLFVRIGVSRQAGGTYDIASSSSSSASSAVYVPKPLEHIDNLWFLVDSGDALLADFVEDMLSELKEKAEELE